MAGTASGPYDVCVVVIARDSAALLPRLLNSVRPWVDRMLVLDTGSVDATSAVAVDLGARVGHFEWCDDFSAARNAALAQADAAWHLVLDADEWLLEGGEYLRSLKRLRPDFVGALHLEDRADAPDAPVVDHFISRLLPGAVRYAGRVHEQPVHRLPARRIPVRVGHDGYSPQALAAKRGRNRRLLLQALVEQPDDAYLQYQLGKDAHVYGEQTLAAQHLCHALRDAPVDAPWRPDLMARLLHALKASSRHPEGLEYALAEIGREGGSPCADSPDVFFALGDLLLDWAAQQPAEAIGRLDQAEAAWQRCLDLGERPDIPGAVRGRGSRLAAHNLALIYEGTGRLAEARSLRRRHGLAVADLLQPAPGVDTPAGA